MSTFEPLHAAEVRRYKRPAPARTVDVEAAAMEGAIRSASFRATTSAESLGAAARAPA